ncbi:MAG TPA: DNA glycosylase [Armatimonadota bacterium]|nr:DNA glycosylase [Armatimonadota bacterium]
METVMWQPPGSISIGPDELDLTHTLTPGQSFRWHEDHQGGWTAVVRRRVVRVGREGPVIRYELFPGGLDDAFISDYFRLDIRLESLYDDFARADGHVVEAVERFKGLRVLRQEPEETLLSYVCSAANSVPRISMAVEALSRHYGEPIAAVDGHDYYSFPTAEALASASVDDLANLCGLGFRGVNLGSVARQLVDRPAGWLESLRQASYDEARAELLGIEGVGLKIADCVLLFSLDKDQAFPVDTHIRRAAVKYYLPEFKQKTLTPAVYRQIASYFQQKFGPYAGWAQEYLFYEDLLRHKPSRRVL